MAVSVCELRIFYVLLVIFLVGNSFKYNVCRLSDVNYSLQEGLFTKNSSMICFYVSFNAVFERRYLASNLRIRRVLHKSTKHGSVCLVLPCTFFIMDLAVYMDVSRNPGPDQDAPKSKSFQSFKHFSQCRASMSRLTTTNLNYSTLPVSVFNNNNLTPYIPAWCLHSYCITEASPFWERYDSLARSNDFPLVRSSPIPVIITQRSVDIRCYRPRFRNNLVQVKRLTPDYHQEEKRPVKFGLWNCQSIRNKTACFTDYICSKNVDLFALTETWLTGTDAAIKAECTPDGYKMLGESRSDRKGGGTALVYRSNISAQKIEVDVRNSFEVSEFVLVGSSWRMRMAVIYTNRLIHQSIQ